MRCLSDELIEGLAAEGGTRPTNHRIQGHLLRCPACRLRLQKAQDEAALIHDLRELRQKRDEIRPLMERSAERDGVESDSV